MFCKSTLSPIVNEQIVSNPRYCFHNKKQILLIADDYFKRIEVKDNLTAVKQIMMKN